MDPLTPKLLEKAAGGVVKAVAFKLSHRALAGLRWSLVSMQYRNSQIRVSCSAFLRIRNDRDRFLLVRNLHRPDFYAPLGGCYKFFPGTGHSSLERFEYRPDEAFAHAAEATHDLRGYIKGRYLGKFIPWFQSRPECVETHHQCLHREIAEELFQEAVLDHPQTFVLHDLQFVHALTYIERSKIAESGSPQIRLFQVFDLNMNSAVSHDFLNLVATSRSDALLWVTARDIEHGRAGHNDALIGHAATLFITRKTTRPDFPPKRVWTNALEAERHAGVRKHPLLIVLLGVSGAGKTTLAEKVQRRLPHSQLLDTDIIAVPTLRDGFVVRSHADTFAIYDAMREMARSHLREGRDVIWCQALTLEKADPSHPQPAGRCGLIALAEEMHIEVAFIHCTAPPEVLRVRLRHRTRPSRSGRPWSEILDRMLETWEPISFPHLKVDTDRKVELDSILRYLESRRSRSLSPMPQRRLRAPLFEPSSTSHP